MDKVKEAILMYALKYGAFRFSNMPLESPIKIEIDKILVNPEATKIIVLRLIDFLGNDLSSVGGVATGGIHWAARASNYLSIPEFCIQKNGDVSGALTGSLVGIIEDVVTTGTSLDKAVDVINNKMKDVNLRSISIFNYGFRKDIPAFVYFDDIRNEIEPHYRDKVNSWHDLAKLV